MNIRGPIDTCSYFLLLLSCLYILVKLQLLQSTYGLYSFSNLSFVHVVFANLTWILRFEVITRWQRN